MTSKRKKREKRNLMIYNSKQKQLQRENLKKIERERRMDALIGISQLIVIAGIGLAVIVTTLNLIQ